MTAWTETGQEINEVVFDYDANSLHEEEAYCAAFSTWNPGRYVDGEMQEAGKEEYQYDCDAAG